MTDVGYSLGDAYGSVIISTNVGEAMDQATRQFDAGIAGMSQSIKAWGDSLIQMGAQLSILTEPLRGMISDGFTAVGDFDQIMTEISARTGLTGDALDDLRETARRMGAETVFSAQEAGEALLQLLTSGMNVEDALATLPSVLDAAAAGGESLGQTADIVTDIMAAFGLEVGDAAMVVDALARASGASSADMGSLGQGFGNVGGVAHLFGLSVNETAAALAIFSENGIKGGEAGTTLKSMLLNMTRSTKETRGAWKELGVSLYDANGNVRNLDTVIKELDASMDKMPVELQNELMMKLAGSYGITGLAALRNGMSISEMTALMMEQATASDVSAAMMGTLNTMVDSLRGSWETFLEIALGPTVEEYIKPLINALIDLLNEMMVWASANPEVTQTFVILAMAIAGLGPALIAMGMALSFGGAALMLLLSPVTLVTGAIFALGVAFRNQIGFILSGFARLVADLQNGGVSKAIKGAFGTGVTVGWVEDVLISFGMVQTSAEQLSRSMGRVFTEVANGVDRLIGDLQSGGVSGAIFGMFGQDGDKVQVIGWFQRVMEAFGMTEESAQSLTYSLGGTFRQIYEVVGPIVERIARGFEWATYGFDQFAISINRGAGTLRALTETAATMFTGFLWGIGAITDENELRSFHTGLFEMIEGIVEGIDGLIASAVNLGSRLVSGFKWAEFGMSQFSESLADGVQPLQALADTVGVMFTNFLWGIGAINDVDQLRGLQDSWIEFVSTIANVFYTVRDAISGAWQGVTIFINGFNAFRNEGFGVFDSLRKQINLFMGLMMPLAGMGGETTSAIQQWLVTAITNIERVFNAAGSVIDSVWKWLSGLGDQIGGFDLSGLKQLIGPLYELASWLLSWGNPFWMAFMVLKTMGVDFIQLIEDVARGVVTFFDTLSSGGSLGDAFGSIFGPEIVDGVTTGVSVVSAVIQDFIDLLAGLWDFVSPALNNLGNWFTSDVLPAIGSVIVNGVLPALQSLADFLGQLWAIVSPHLAAFADWFLYSILPQIQQFISGTIIPGFEQLIQTVTRVWNDVSPFLLQFADWFLNSALPTIMDFIQVFVMPIIDAFIQLLTGIWATISPALESMYNWFIRDGLPFISGAFETLRDWVQKVIDIIKAIWEKSRQDVENLKNGLQAAANWIDTNVIQPIIKLVNSIIDAFKGIWNAIKPAVDEFKKGVEGVLSGITTAIENVMKALGLAQQEELKVTTTVNANGDVIESHSPVDGNGKGYSINKTKQAETREKLLNLKGYTTGVDFIQRESVVKVHPGEAILTANQNAQRKDGSDRPSIIYQIAGIYANTYEEGREVVRGLEDEIEERMRGNG